MAKLLVLGAGGLLGINFALEASRGHEVLGTVNRVNIDEAPFRTRQADLLEAGAGTKLLEEIEADWLINCVALANVDECEHQPELATRLNIALPASLAKECRRRGIQMLHISTDAVFDGEDGPYSEKDEPRPLSVYGQSKLEGEQRVLDVNPDALVARVNFFGWGLGGDRSLAEFFYNNLSAGIAVPGLADRFFSPLLVNDLVRLLLLMMNQGLSGLFHVAGTTGLSKYQFGVALAERFGFNSELIQRADSESLDYSAKRASDLRLGVEKLSGALDLQLPDAYSGIEGLWDLFIAGYPQKLRTMQATSVENSLS